MADNVAISAGVGTSIATDDISGVHYQKVKMAIGTTDRVHMLRPVTVTAATASTADVTVASSSGILFGWMASASTTLSTVRVDIRDSTSSSTGKIVSTVFLSTGAGAVRSQTVWFGPQGLLLASGIRLVRNSTALTNLAVYFVSPA